MKIIKRNNLTMKSTASLMGIVVLFAAFSFLFTGCSTGSSNGTFQVSFYLGGVPLEGSTVEVQNGYKIPMTNADVASHAGGRGLYKGTAQDLDKFWTVLSGPGAGEIWDFNNPVTGDLMLMAEDGTPPVAVPTAGRGKEFYDNVMNYINDRRFAGSYIMALGEDAGQLEDQAAGIKYKEVKDVTFSPGVDLTIVGIGAERKINTKGSRVLVLPGNAEGPISLTLGKNVTIVGSEASSSQGMIRVGDELGGNMNITFTMLDGSKITGYFSDRPGSVVGGGVVVVSGSVDIRNNNILFDMKGGEITGNTNLWLGGQNCAGVAVNRAKMLMEGDAKITGNSGFGGDVAFGVNSDYPMPDNLFIEIQDTATIGEVYLFASVSAPATGYLSPFIKIHDGWSGTIDKLDLGWYVVDGKQPPVLPGFWVNNPCIRNAAATGSAAGTIAPFVSNITLGGSFHWNTGLFWSDGFAGYRISTTTGMLTQ
ncbi:MAG: hypothetical protein FWF29_00025 [Treponema sp.]|nr:hypothetical protein [Treponema sp.]